MKSDERSARCVRLVPHLTTISNGPAPTEALSVPASDYDDQFDNDNIDEPRNDNSDD